MRIYFMPVKVPKWLTGDGKEGMMFLHRKGKVPELFLRNLTIWYDHDHKYQSLNGPKSYDFCGEFKEGQSFDRLQDGDTLFFTVQNDRYGYENWYPFYLDMYPQGDMLLPFQGEATVLGLAASMESMPEVYLYTPDSEQVIKRARQIHQKARDLYSQYPVYQHIMLRSGDEATAVSLVQLASRQDPKKHETLMALFLALSKAFQSSQVANRILENCEFDESFSLMTQEEQVGTFIEFSKMSAAKKKEMVSDALIEQIQSSEEYARVLEDMGRNGLGISPTQQFNVFQQVGYFSDSHNREILYNLSDMGAGKTLMTVEAIFLLDLKQISTWNKIQKDLDRKLEVDKVFVPDKHIIAPTLSVKSSWVDTFRLFYDVEEIDEMTYELTVEYAGIKASSHIYIAPFTVKDGKIFVRNQLPPANNHDYLIIDEIHQLVIRNIPKTKFFPPKTNPSERYKSFILSGTMSNLRTEQWYNFMRFMGIPVTDHSASAADAEATRLTEQYRDTIRNAARNLKSEQHRYFDAENLTPENSYNHQQTKKRTSIEREFYARYGTQILETGELNEGEEIPIQQFLTNAYRGHYLQMETDPSLTDAINFELFYEIVGRQAITAQSMQIAEELFGEQKKQHVSDIIKTVSPLSKEDIQILKTLHHIAEDHNKYKSVAIAKAINNAILNLNDGLQTKNIYDIVSGYADKNLRFFEYLSSLDVNILEQLPKSGLIKMPKLQDTDKFKVLQDILRREKDETHLIVVNDYYALKALSDALGIEHLTKDQVKRELDYQEVLDALFEKQSIVIVTQDMIKSSLDLVQANRLIQYQLNTEISDIIQTQNRINRIGQTRETRGYYIASDQLQENLIELFLEQYRNIRVAHKGIVELFTDITSQINVVNDYLERAFSAIEQTEAGEPDVVEEPEVTPEENPSTDLISVNTLPEGAVIASDGEVTRALLFPQNGNVLVLVPLTNGNAFPLGSLKPEKAEALNVTVTTQIHWDLISGTIIEE